ncbi:MAG: hypothetical protein ACFFBD_05210 [Candidatus Hodarchaeota archaeon]
MSFVDELFGSLKKSNTAADIRRVLQQLRQEASKNPARAQEMARQALELLQSYAQDLATKQQHRKAAQQFYTGARLIKEFFPDQAQLANEWYRITAENLVFASNTYRDFGDIEGAAAVMAIRSILLFLSGHWEVDNHMNEFVQRNRALFESSETASAIVHIPYELVKSYNNVDRDALFKAESFIQSYLARIKVVDTFTEALQEIIPVVKEKFSKDIKLPRIRAEIKQETQDLVFGKSFRVDLVLENIGEGEAKKFAYSVTLDSGLEMQQGEKSGQYDQVMPGEVKSLQYQLNCPSGDGAEEIAKQFSMSGSYDDILGNRRTVLFGPFEIIIRAKLKSEELRKTLQKSREVSKVIIDTLSGMVSEENKSKPLADGIISMFQGQLAEAERLINGEEFVKAELIIQQGAKLLKNIAPQAQNLFEEIKKQGNLMEEALEKSATEINNLNVKLQEMQKNLSEIEEILK